MLTTIEDLSSGQGQNEQILEELVTALEKWLIKSTQVGYWLGTGGKQLDRAELDAVDFQTKLGALFVKIIPEQHSKNLSL
jgi:hypothetical protein